MNTRKIFVRGFAGAARKIVAITAALLCVQVIVFAAAGNASPLRTHWLSPTDAVGVRESGGRRKFGREALAFIADGIKLTETLRIYWKTA